ncbi:hypothetical protein NDU88_000926 [Pleurodeles waltl]|uniref:Uncharacterized protein n=1 Tax=Pleurodeles waltl TaxID=8319 RepID=A0AAV7S5Y5_PLEWA|nr:hypothetical protein NDU88_000926 [Pleurodeles waltl]
MSPGRLVSVNYSHVCASAGALLARLPEISAVGSARPHGCAGRKRAVCDSQETLSVYPGLRLLRNVVPAIGGLLAGEVAIATRSPCKGSEKQLLLSV